MRCHSIPNERSAITFARRADGSKRDSLVTEAADAAGIAMLNTGLRLFLH